MDIQRKLLIRDLKRLLQVLPAKTRLRVAGLLVLMLILALVEVASIFSISLMAMSVATPENILNHPKMQLIYGWFPFLRDLFADTRYFSFTTGVLVVAFIVLKNAFTALTNWRSAVLGEDISKYAGCTIMDHFLKSDYMAHMAGDSTAMFQALNWRTHLGTFLVNIMSTYTYAFTAVALLVTVLSATPGAILTTLAVICAIVYVVYRSMKTSIDKNAHTASQTSADQNRITMMAMKGIREVILYHQQETFFDKFAKSCENGRRPQAFLRIAPPIPTWILETFGFLSIPTTIFLLIQQGSDMVAITAVVTMIMLVAWRVLPILNKSLGCLVHLRVVRPMAMTCLDKLEEIQRLHLPAPAEPDPNFHFDKTLALDNVSFRYPGAERDSLSHISLSISHGEQIGFIGASGSGKTTLAGILCGLMNMREGQMLVDGEPLTDSRRAAYIQRVGYVSQSPYIFNGTVAENVAFSQWGKPYDEERVKEACHMAALDIVEKDSKGILYPIGDNGAGLSGGQAQRVSIARALYARPDVLILDESTSALDIGTEQAIMETIQKLKGHLTIIIIAHRLSTVERCDRLFWVEEGHLHKVGTPAELLPEYTASLISKELTEQQGNRQRTTC